MNIDTPPGLTLLTLGGQTVLPATTGIGTNATAEDWLAFEHALQAQRDQLQTAENSVAGATDASVSTSLNANAAALLFASVPAFAWASGKFLPPTTSATSRNDIDLAETLDRLQNVLRHISAARGEETEVSALTLTDERIFEMSGSMTPASADQVDDLIGVTQKMAVSERVMPTTAESPDRLSIFSPVQETLKLDQLGSMTPASADQVDVFYDVAQEMSVSEGPIPTIAESPDRLSIFSPVQEILEFEPPGSTITARTDHQVVVLVEQQKIATGGEATAEKTAGFVAVAQNSPLSQAPDDNAPASSSTQTAPGQDESWMTRFDATLASVAPSVFSGTAQQANAVPTVEASGNAASVNLPTDTGEVREWSVLDRLMRRNADLLNETTPALRDVAAEPSKASQESVVGDKPVLFDQTWAQRLSALNPERWQDGAKPSTIELQRPINDPQWADDLGEKVVWLGQQSRTSAEIRLNPQSLGPISIKIDMDQDRATIAFGAQHAVTREALEAALPKLREMLGNQNIQLTEVNISQHGYPGERSQSGFSQFSGQEQRAQQDDTDFPAPPLQQPGKLEDIEILGRGLVSYYV